MSECASTHSITTPCVTLKTVCVKTSVNIIACWCSVCCFSVKLYRNTRLAIPKKTFEIVSKCSCFKTSVCVHVCVFIDQRPSRLSGWALCFDFFSSSLRSNASPLSYAARTSLEGLQSLSPSTYEFPPPSPFLKCLLFLLPLPISSWLPVLICWSSPLCPTPTHVWICNAQNKAGLRSCSLKFNIVLICQSYSSRAHCFSVLSLGEKKACLQSKTEKWVQHFL